MTRDVDDSASPRVATARLRTGGPSSQVRGISLTAFSTLAGCSNYELASFEGRLSKYNPPDEVSLHRLAKCSSNIRWTKA